MRYIQLIAINLLVLLTACSGNNNTDNQETTPQSAPVISTTPIVKDSFEIGKVLPTITCKANPTESFALYVPTSYSTTTTALPVILFFDPHGDGNIPVEKYAQLAEKSNYILIGSNNSKNGIPFQQSLVVANNLLSDVLQRLKIDVSQITFCGFSGGAKVAMLAAAENNQVSRVVYCGAVQPWQSLNHPLSLLGFAGLRDMNYSDLASFQLSQTIAQLPHYMIEWSGKHEWPDVKTFAYAMLPNWANIPANELIKIDDQKLAVLNKEQTQKQELITAFNTQDINWWKQKISSLNTTKKTDLVNERLLGFISLACYSMGNQTLGQNNLPAAKKVLTIYQLAEPGNKDCEAMWQQYKQMGGN
jgi:pimeloyl-ACP methyl ester carboxylesterase